ncbi:peptidase inhibitor family I36 protein [Kitasatospora sp. NPDC087271]|uniref:peptidase inhibitor family I36 protein n=1 Tax=Kitasatospora sp. NPDC087271 TaxID=3364067 RepID=UPI003819C1A8
MTVREIRGHGVDACPDGFLALYEHSDFNGWSDGRILLTDESIPNLKDHNFNDVTSSVVQKMPGNWIILWTDTRYGGTSFPLQSDTREYPNMIDFSKIDVRQNDTISSVQFRG